MEQEQWPQDWLRGVLELCVLNTLTGGASYGYEIAASLSMNGLGPIKGGTLYPLLKRMESAELVDVEWRAGDGGPGRKYYLLTDSGRTRHAELGRAWSRFSEVVGAMATPHSRRG